MYKVSQVINIVSTYIPEQYGHFAGRAEAFKNGIKSTPFPRFQATFLPIVYALQCKLDFFLHLFNVESGDMMI